MDYDSGQSEPTQTLLTALGRFQRQVAKAQTGSRQEEWSDECMNQLIGAVEIAIEQDWVDVVEALTDTARILHSYEDANRADRCVPFLADSYELLCLMVGDLIVDNVRPSVMEKWRRRFAAALDDLQSEGLRLIQDDETHEPTADTFTPSHEPQPTETPSGEADESPFSDVETDGRDGDRLEDDLPALDELPPLQGAESVGVESITIHEELSRETGLDPIEPMSSGDDSDRDALPEMPMIGDVGYLPTDPEPFSSRKPVSAVEAKPETQPKVEESAEDEHLRVAELDLEPPAHSFEEIESGFDEADVGADQEIEEAPELSDDSEDEESADELYALDEPPSRRSLEPAVVQHLDALCDELARLERGEELDQNIVFATIEGRLDSLRIHAHSGRRPNAERLCQSMAGMCASVAAAPDLMGDKFFELAYAFCGLYADADGEDDASSESAWYDEVETLKAGASESAPEQAVEPTSDEVPDQAPEAAPLAEDVFELPADDETEQPEEAVENLAAVLDQTLGGELASIAEAKPSAVADLLLSLLSGAQKAAADGDIAHAKSLALEAAVKIAEAEVDVSQRALDATDRRLEDNRTALEEAHVGAATAEAAVGASESQVTDGEAALAEVRRRIGETQQSLNGVEQRIADIEEQIRALEAERDAESERAQEIRATLETERRTESDSASDLDRRRDEETRAREHLDQARQRIASLESQREQTRSDRERAESILGNKRRSLAELEQTVRVIQGKAHDEH